MANRDLPRDRRRRMRPSEESISGALLDVIETERGRLLKVESLLSCLSNSMEYEQDAPSAAHYPDVAQVACDLLRQSIDELDPLILGRLINRRGIKDEQIGLASFGGYCDTAAAFS